jgi:hypothetical protein
MPAVALGWPKNKKYASPNAAAVQYCSLLYKKESEGPTARKLILPISMPGRKHSCRAGAGFWLIGSEKIWDRGTALPSGLRWFETEVLSQAGNLEGLRRINRELIARRRPCDGPQRVVLNIDSTVIPSTENRSTVPTAAMLGWLAPLPAPNEIERRDPGQVGSGTIHSELGSGGKSGRKWRS